MYKEAEPAVMRFISYAQNFEDVMLWRALKHVENGFFIDVGANDPVADSVTKAFYDRGWRGINIEPLPSHCDDLRAQRLRDITLCCAAGEAAGEIEIYDCDVRGWASGDKTAAERHARQGHQGVWRRVPMRTLADICHEHVTGPIHFLKIDVEGMESQVIKGADLNRYRPWVVVVETALPQAAEEAREPWDEALRAQGYRCAYGDGLNRFYVVEEQPGILAAFRYPPNVLDGFVHVEQVNLESRIRRMEDKARRAEDRAARAEARARALAQELVALYSSTSWRFTVALRRAVRSLDALRSVRLSAACKRAAGVLAPKLLHGSRPWRWTMGLPLGALRRFLGGHPRIKALLGKILSPFPGLTASLKYAGTASGISARDHQAEGVQGISPRTHRIYVELEEVVLPHRNRLK